jgi:hypothetical protein
MSENTKYYEWHAWYSPKHARQSGNVMIWADRQSAEHKVTHTEKAELITKPLSQRYPYEDAVYVGVVNVMIRCESVVNFEALPDDEVSS